MKSLSLAAAAVLASTAAHASLHDGHRVERSLAIHRRGAAKLNRRVKHSSSSTETTAIWWAEDGWQGACGVATDNGAMQVGLPLSVYSDPTTKSALCGTTAYATNPANGQSVTVTVVDGSDRTDFTTFSKAAYSALGGNLDTGMLPIVLSLSKDAAAAAKKVAAVNVASSATSVVAAATPEKTSAPEVPASTVAQQQKSSEKVTQAPTSTVDAAASSVAAKKAYESQQAQVLAASQASADAAAAAASSKAAADAAASSSAAAAAAASSKAAAQEAAASSSAAAAAASSKAAADAAASSSSAAAAAAAAKATQDANANKGGNSGGNGGKVFSGGIATYFYQNGVAGNCGAVNPDSAMIVALPTATYANGAHCGQTVTITRTDTGESIQAKVADSCPTCNNNACLDLSTAVGVFPLFWRSGEAFKALGGTDAMGVFDITWHFN
ncbi:expansin family protein [Rhodotorula toruloides]|nr:expansin family protein [Rhodotorula toruloides]